MAASSIIIIMIFVSVVLFILGIIQIALASARKRKSKKIFLLLLISGILCFSPAACTTITFIRGSLEIAESRTEEMGPLFIAIKKNNLEEISTQLEKTDINIIRRFVCESYYTYHTPLSYASYLNNDYLVKYFLENRADPNLNIVYDKKEGSQSWTPLMYATKNKNYEIINLLIQNRADINKGNERDNPFTLSLKYGDLNLVDFIYKNGANNKVGHLRFTKSCIFILVEKNPDIDILNYIYNNKIDIKINHYADNTPFIESVEQNNPNNFTLQLYEMGADIFINDKWNMNSLYYAGKNNNYEMVEFLVKKGISLNQRNYRGETPFFYIAASFCYDNEIELRMKILNFLIEQGSDPAEKDYEQMSIIERSEDFDRSTKIINNLEKLIKEY